MFLRLSRCECIFCRRISRDAPFWRESIRKAAIISACVDSVKAKGGVDVGALRFNWVSKSINYVSGIRSVSSESGRKEERSPFPINLSCLRLIVSVVEWMIYHWARASHAWYSVKGETNELSMSPHFDLRRTKRTDMRAVNVRRVRIPVGIISLYICSFIKAIALWTCN